MVLSISQPYQTLIIVIPRDKALWMILMSLVDMGFDTEKAIFFLGIDF